MRSGWNNPSEPSTPRASLDKSPPMHAMNLTDMSVAKLAAAPDCRVKETFALHAPTRDEQATLASLAARERSARVTVMPTHHISEYGDLTGFRFDCGPHASGACLPISRRMFFGHTLVECTEGEAEILRLMSRPSENRKIIADYMRSVETECTPALLDCVPDNSDALTGYGLLQVKRSRTFHRCKITF